MRGHRDKDIGQQDLLRLRLDIRIFKKQLVSPMQIGIVRGVYALRQQLVLGIGNWSGRSY